MAFLFPHSGRKGMHHLNTQLLNAFVASAAPLLTHDGRVEVTLAAGQGGTPADGAHLRPQPADSWQVHEAAAAAGLLLTAAVPFHTEAWGELGYTRRGCWRGFTQGFHADVGAVVHVLQLPGGCPPHERRSAYPPVYQRDLTVWADHWPAGDDEAAAAALDRTLHTLVADAPASQCLQHAAVVEVRCPASARVSVSGALERSRASPPHRPREDRLAHPADTSRSNLAAAWAGSAFDGALASHLEPLLTGYIG